MHHADKLMDRIIFLEGHPNLQTLDPLRIGESPTRDAGVRPRRPRYDARTLYKEARDYCEKVGDYVSKNLFEELMTDEEGHIDFLETQLDLVDRIGEAELGPAQRPADRRGGVAPGRARMKAPGRSGSRSRTLRRRDRERAPGGARHRARQDGAKPGPSPMELVLIGTGGCSAWDVVNILQKGRAGGRGLRGRARRRPRRRGAARSSPASTCTSWSAAATSTRARWSARSRSRWRSTARPSRCWRRRRRSPTTSSWPAMPAEAAGDA